MTSPECPSRDFKFVESYQPISDENRGSVSGRSSQQSFYSAPSHAPGSQKSNSQFLRSMREGSVYLDAYTGDEMLD